MAGTDTERDAQVAVFRTLFENALVAMIDYFRGVMDGHEKEVARLKHALAARDSEIATLKARVRYQKDEAKA